MTRYQLREPALAVQYRHPDKGEEVYALLNARGGASFKTDTGHLRCWNMPGAQTVEVADGNWVVAVADQFVVLGSQQFHELFEADGGS